MTEGTKYLTADEKAALRERLARLKTPKEMVASLDVLREAVAEVIVIGQRLLDSKTAKYPNDNARYQ